MPQLDELGVLRVESLHDALDEIAHVLALRLLAKTLEIQRLVAEGGAERGGLLVEVAHGDESGPSGRAVAAPSVAHPQEVDSLVEDDARTTPSLPRCGRSACSRAWTLNNASDTMSSASSVVMVLPIRLRMSRS
jgi:hypothetical protein